MNKPANDGEAFLEKADGTRAPVKITCAIGRVAGNEVVLEGERVSRRHALLTRREAGEHWLMDLGSRNGTFLNRRRLLQPVKLADGDEIEIGGHTLRFHQGDCPAPSTTSTAAAETIREVQSIPCWLLVADMEDSTQFITRTSPERFAERTQQWLTRCRETVERHGGAINKFLGDGFFAYWRHHAGAARQVVDAVTSLRTEPGAETPQFRVAIHLGTVVVGGGASLGEESLMGPEVHFVFRLEKLAATLAKDSLVSAPAARQLEELLPLENVGSHHLHGFEGDHVCYSIPDSPFT